MRTDLVKREANKFFFRSGVMFFMIAAVFLKGVLLKYDSGKIDGNIEAERDRYLSYMQQIEGPPSDEKTEFIRSKAENISQTDKRLSELALLFKDREIGAEDYVTERKKLLEGYNERTVINILFHECEYVDEAPEDRYYLYKNGWLALLNEPEMDIILMVSILGCALQSFGGEYLSGMDTLLLTTQKGRKTLFFCKLFFGGLCVFLLSAMWSGIEFLHIFRLYGLPHPEYPLKSIASFEISFLNITLGEAVFCVWILRLLGCLLLYSFTLFLSVSTKRTLLSFFGGSMTLLIPYFAFNGFLLTTIPTPLGLWRGSLWLSQQEKWRGVTLPVLSVLLIVILLVLSARVYLKKRIIPIRCKAGSLAAIFLLALFLSGCGVSEKNFYYHSSFGDAAYAENELMITDPDLSVYSFETKQWKKEALDPFALGEETQIFLSSSGEKICYAIRNKNITRFYKRMPKDGIGNEFFRLGATSVSVFDSRLWLPDRLTSFDLLPFAIAVHDNEICYISNNMLYAFHMLSGNKRILGTDLRGLWGIAGEQYYYISSSGGIRYGAFSSGKTKSVDLPSLSYAVMEGKYLFFKENDLPEIIHVFNLSDQMLTDSFSGKSGFIALKGYLYYIEGNSLYSYNSATKEKKILFNDAKQIIIFSENGDVIIIMKKDGSPERIMLNDAVS